MNKIEVLFIDSNGFVVLDHSWHETLKDARAWIKECGLSAEYHDRAAEREGWAKDNIHTIQLHKNDKCLQDWFPKWK